MPKLPGLVLRKFSARKSSAVKSLTQRAAASVYETLETRIMMTVSLNANGATVITPDAGDKVIYVSSSTGNDKNNGLSPQTPVATFTRAEDLMSNHTGDEMLLKTGDTWNGSFGYWAASGASAQDPIVIGSYGTGARPVVMTGTSNGFMIGSVSENVVNYVALMGINFIANGRDPNLTSSPLSGKDPTGISVLATSNDILIENCETQYYQCGIVIEKSYGELQNVSLRRNIVVDSYSVNTHSEGIYCLGVTNLTITGNVVDANGYNNQVPGAVPSWYNQDCYLSSSNTGVVITDNIFSRAGGYGLQDRPGGIVEDNMFIDDPVGMTFGLVNGATTTAGGVTGEVSGNVFYGGADLSGTPGGQQLVLGNIKPGAGAVVSENIFTSAVADSQPAIALDFGNSQADPQDSVGINNLTLTGNIIYDWTSGIDIENQQVVGGTGLKAFNDVTITNNDFEDLSSFPINNRNGGYTSTEHISGNAYYSTGESMSSGYPTPVVGQVRTTPFPFAAPTRSVASYDTSIHGSGTVAAFLAAAATQNETSWNAAYDASGIVNYFKAGFGLSTSTPVTPPPVTTTPTGTAATSTFKALQVTNQSGGLKNDGNGGLGYIYGGDWAEYGQINFGTGVAQFSASLAALTSGGTIQLRLGSPTGTLIGTLKVSATGSWSKYTTQTTTVSGATGVQNLYLVFTGGAGVCNVLSFSFSTTVTSTAASTTTTPTGTAATSTFDALQVTSQSGGLKNDGSGGLGYIYGGDWAEYGQVNFGSGVTKFSASLAALTSGGTIQLRLGSPTGTLVGTLKVSATGAWNKYTTQTATVSGATGLQNLYLVFTGGAGVCNVLTFSFS